jgi:primosomal protein N' (replication factor Y)
VTGSGKTEVYLAAVQAALDAGQTAIVLVPEIALTPQALGRFQARFGDVVAVLHSALSDGERHDEWMRLRVGEARVCVGPRSAVLAPLRDVGLIVVDEEHESSYKHEGDPRYDARGVARWRARHHGALLVFGSATPRPETVLQMRRLSLPRRVDGRPMPPVEVLDMRESHQPLHPETRMALADLRHGGGKAIMLLNRRGWSNFLSCRSCGHVWLCPNCEVALVLHGGGRAAQSLHGYVACHHCGHREPIPERCTECASVSVARHGAGTERVEHELREAVGTDRFPVFRLDAGAATLEARARTLQAFERAPAGVLVGTQMVAKGHDFPDVSLGVVLDADQTLRFPDFRAEERTFSLVTQLAGRIGRGGGGGEPAARQGRVLVQTLAPDARPLSFAAEHDSDGFVADELTRRRALSYPPYASLIRIICSSEEEAPALEVVEVEPEADEPVELDPEVRARRDRALAHVRKFGDPVLRTRARDVDRFDKELVREVAQMGELMNDAIGVGLAATQVGVLHRVLVYRVHPQSPVAALVNPELEWAGRDTETLEEGCLSLPGVHVQVERPVFVRVRARNEHGEPILVEASGLEARVIQHEMDHLDGVLVLDRISRSERKEAMKALRAALGDG